MISSLQQLHSAAKRTRNFSIKLRSCLLGERGVCFSRREPERRHVSPHPTAKQGKGKSAAQFVRGLWTCEGPCYELKQKEEKNKKDPLGVV